MKQILISAVAGIGLAGCCFGGLTQGGGGGGQAFTLAPGFTPDPAVATGTAGGLRDASSLGAGCRGYIGMTANHVLTATAAFPNLRIAANGGDNDITLVVQRPDGTYLCNDDSEGLNPMVEGPFAAGAYQIFVGAYSADSAGATYRLGISELGSTTPSSLGNP